MSTSANLKTAFNTLWNEGIQIMPTILIGLLILIGGWIIAKLVSSLVQKILTKTGNSKLSKSLKLDSVTERFGMEVNFPKIISKVVYWIIFLFFIVAASETFGWSNVSKEISVFIHYLPRILSALLIFALGYSIVVFIRDAVKSVTKSMGIGLGNVLANVLFYFLILIVSLTALAQAGVNIAIVSTHMFIIIAGFALTFAISFGLGAREVVGDLLKNYYNRGVLNVGDDIIYGELKGIVEKISKTSVVINVKNVLHVIPSKDFYATSYNIMKKEE